MPDRPNPRAERRQEALSRDRIVATAVELLDADGEQGLTFRALATRLSTGAGAIYWHVANKDELLTAATDAMFVPILDVRRINASPPAKIRTIGLSVFDAMDAHPWIGPQLSRTSWQTSMLELIGQQLQLAGVPAPAQFTAASTLVSFILGASSQNAVNASVRAASGTRSRSDSLGAVADRWARLDPDEYPFVHQIAGAIGEHDDREQFLAGVDLLLTGIGLLGQPTP
ncbi:MAG: TetR family transcriptional regulator [Actinobacteria bacterium]|nr:TetR family transcriptional regulator [Actinomycetota bacterium]MCG2803301.1 TetR family transcriptional regulator [Cellulomonas sp.]